MPLNSVLAVEGGVGWQGLFPKGNVRFGRLGAFAQLIR